MREAPRGGDAHDDAARLAPEPAGDRLAGRVVDADDGEAASAARVEDALLRGDVAVHAAMAVEVVGRDVEENGDVEARRRAQLELVARHLEHVGAVLALPRQRERGHADVAAHGAA
jgi:hypothetical protein